MSLRRNPSLRVNLQRVIITSLCYSLAQTSTTPQTHFCPFLFQQVSTTGDVFPARSLVPLANSVLRRRTHKIQPVQTWMAGFGSLFYNIPILQGRVQRHHPPIYPCPSTVIHLCEFDKQNLLR